MSTDRRRKHLRVLRAQGTYTYIPAGPVSAHVRSLLAAGMTQVEIADAAAVGRSTIHRYTHTGKRIHADVARRIIAVTPGPVERETGYVPAVGTVRRLRALVAVGWSMRHLSELSGMTLRPIAVTGRTVVCVETARTVEDLFDRLAMTPGPSIRAREFARARGWVSALAWDDIDDPHARPDLGSAVDVEDEVAVDLALSGRSPVLSQADRLAAARRIVERGAGASEVARVLRVNGHTAKTLVRRIREDGAA